MKILANENIPGEAVRLLRERGHDVAWAREDSPGASDQELLSRGQAERRLLLTFDKDFGRLAFATRVPAAAGIILLRIEPQSPGEVARFLVRLLETRADWAGHFAVAFKDGVRLRPLPPA